MSEPVANGAAAEALGPTFSVEKIYVKDVSYEAPNAPQVFGEQGQPNLEMNLNPRVQRVGDSLFEVELGVTLTCKLADKTVYLVEVRQAGLFGLNGFDEPTLDAMLGAHCPSILYPYARQIVSDMISAGGFPPFVLQPINFEGMYADGLRQRQAQQAAGQLGDVAGNA
jgi:preprotein translocase subunit SecB